MRSIILALTLLWAGTAVAEPRIDAVQAKLPEQARKALDGIGEPDRKLLALRSYLRSAKSLEARWSWTQAEIDAYLKSDQYVSAMAAVAAVTLAFEVKNPGYTLHVNTEVRSLEEQIGKWNNNASVKSASAGFDAAATKWLADNPNATPDGLRAFIVDWTPPGTSMLAAPGLTNHGRGEAIDFQVAKGAAIIAGAGGSAEWNADGWTSKLQEAVRLSMMPFKGPLTDPNEPWHYDYNPPERSKLVVAAKEATTTTAATRPWAANEPKATPVANAETPPGADTVPPVVGVVPVPTPRPDSAKTETADASAEKPEVAKVEPAKAEPAKVTPAKPKKASKKHAKAPKKRIKRAKARKAAKRWPF